MAFIFTLILFAATLILSEVLKPKVEGERQRPASLGDFKLPTAVEGRPVPLIWGTVKLEGPNVVWYGDLVTTAIKEKVKTGLFSSKSVTTGFRYNVGIQMGLCRGTVDELLRIWIGEDVVFNGNATPSGGFVDVTIDEPKLFGGKKGQGGVEGTVRMFEGSETQGVHAYLQPFQQQGGDTPAYRGTCYVAPATAPVYVGNSTSIQPWRFEVRRTPTQLGVLNSIVNSVDANPAHVLYEILVNDEWGLGFPASDIESSTFTAAAATLATEGNGFSFVLDNQRSLLDLIREIEHQIDGLVINNRLTGKWELNLARADYVLMDLPELTVSNVLEIRDFRRAAWHDTQNHVRVKFADRARDYFETYASAQDMANVQIQNANITADQFFPGVKDRTLANSLAWRELRSLSRPLAKATVVVDRTFFALNPGDPVRWTDTDLGFSDLVMRITQIDLGDLSSGRITLQLVEDVFATDVPSFAAPADTGWTPPVDQLVAIPLADHLSFEAPKAFVDRASTRPGEGPRIWVGARSQGDGAVDADILEDGTDAGDIAGFLLAGELDSAITKEDLAGAASIVIDPTPDTKAALLAALGSGFDASDIGQSLAGLIVIGTEFLAFTAVTDTDPTITLSSGYRGLLDSAPQDHNAGDRVWLAFVNGNVLDRIVDAGISTVEVLTDSLTDTLTSAEATDVSVSVSGNRHLRPYPPATPSVGGATFPSSVNMDVVQSGGLSGDDNKGSVVDFIRRDFRTADEVAAVTSETGLPTDFPAANTTEYRVEVINDPEGSPTSLFITDWATGDGTPIFISRTKVLRFTDGTVPSTLGISIETRHTVDGNVLEAAQQTTHEFISTMAELSGLFNLGALVNLEASNVYSAPVSGTHIVTVQANLDSGDVEYRLNGGSWTSVISSGNSSGMIAGVTAGDTIELRSNGASISDREETLVTIDAPSSSSDAYGILIV